MISFSLSELLKLLDQWQQWRVIRQSPERLDALEKRVAALEGKALAPARPTGYHCHYCLQDTAKLVDERPHPHFPEIGAMMRRYHCPSCGKDFERDNLNDLR